jgi:hypothetical protein
MDSIYWPEIFRLKHPVALNESKPLVCAGTNIGEVRCFIHATYDRFTAIAYVAS